MDRSAFPAAAPSLWETVTPAGAQVPCLEGTVVTDAAVIGAGIAGLSTAFHLRCAGVDVAVIDAVEPGFGASGRANGQIIPDLTRADPQALIDRYGATGERFVVLVRDSAAMLFSLVRENGIDAEAEQTGWVQPAHSPGRVRISERRAQQWSKWGAPVALLSRDETRRMLGSDAWHGAFFNRDGGHINPLGLTRGLARAVLAAGGRIYGRSPVRRFERQNGRWRVQTSRGEVRARALVLATNAYSAAFAPALASEVAREIVPVVSWQAATQPLDDAARRTVIPGRQAMSDTHKELRYARYDARHRLVTGGALVAPINAAERLKRVLAARLRAMWPQIGDLAFDYVWNCQVAMTWDQHPRIHRLGPDAYAWAGCNGRALALSTALGRELAKAVCGAADWELALPFTQPRSLPFHGVLRHVAPLALLAYRLRDRREIA